MSKVVVSQRATLQISKYYFRRSAGGPNPKNAKVKRTSFGPTLLSISYH